MRRALLTQFDLFSIPVIFNFSGQEKHRTYFGAMCSFICLGVLIWAFINASEEMFTRSNAKSTVSETFSSEPRSMVIKSQNFPMAFSIQAPQALNYLPFVNESIFTIKATYYTQVQSKAPDGSVHGQTSSIPINLETCRAEHFGEYSFAFGSLGYEYTLLCIALEQPGLQDLELEGTYVSGEYKAFTIEVFQCNGESSVTCADDNEIRRYLEGAFMNLIYTDMVIDPNNYTDPDFRFQDIYAKTISQSLYKTSTIQLSHISLITDSGWLTENINTKEYVKIGKIIENSMAREPLDTSAPLMSYTFEVSKLETKYSRSYKKILAVLAEVASVANTILLIVFIIISPYLKLKFRETLMNQLFDVDMRVNLDQRKGRKTFTDHELREINRKYDKEMTPDDRRNLTNLQSHHPEIGLALQQEEKLSKRFGIFNTNKPNSDVEISENLKEPETFKNSFETNHLQVQDRLDKEAYKCSFYQSNNKDQQEDEPQPKDDENRKHENSEQPSQIQLPVIEDAQDKQAQIKPNLLVNKEEPINLDVKILEAPTRESPEQCYLEVQMPHGFGVVEEFANPRVENTQERCFAISEPLKLEIEDFEDAEADESEEKIIVENLNKKSDFARLTVWEYLLSFVYKPQSLKNKLEILNTGRTNIGERLDVVNILKKMRELDKIRALLFDPDQLVLFDNLPKPVIKLKNRKALPIRKSFSYEVLNDKKMFGKTATQDELLGAFRRVKNRGQKTGLDERLLKIFKDASM